ncbi:MAG TPA: hypothetical protein VKN18_02040 [Blastocatellia bacterium]|nr:hypothetical protein [Blastocatellia bacterium]
MRRIVGILAKLLPAPLILLGVAFTATVATGQSSGNFAAKVGTAQCVVNDGTGALTGGLTVTLLETTIRTPNSGFTALDIRPSMVSGLFTKTKVTADSSIATAVAGVRVRVLLDGKIVLPGTTAGARPTDGTTGNLPDDGDPNNDGWVYYNKRFQQLSTNIFGGLPVDCDPVADGIQPCFLELILSTLTATSLDWVVGDVGGGDHNVKVEWMLQPTSPTANEAACVGPAILTVTQVKTFSQSGGITVQ